MESSVLGTLSAMLLQPTYCVTLGNSLDLSEFSFPSCPSTLSSHFEAMEQVRAHRPDPDRARERKGAASSLMIAGQGQEQGGHRKVWGAMGKPQLGAGLSQGHLGPSNPSPCSLLQLPKERQLYIFNRTLLFLNHVSPKF